MSMPLAVQRWAETWQGSLNVEQLMGLFTEDVRMEDVASGITFNAKSDFRQWMSRSPFAQLSELKLIIIDHAIRDDHVFLEVELSAKAPNGQSVLSRGVSVFHVRGDKLSFQRAYYLRQGIVVSGKAT